MNAKKCDRCGAYYTIFDRDIFVVDKKLPLYSDESTIDLCPDCQMQLEEFLNTHKRKDIPACEEL